MTPAQFIAKWSRNLRNERAASQEHFLDICAMLEHPTPNDDPTGEQFAFEKGATKHGGGQGFADVWKREFFAWEYKGKHKDLDVAMAQVAQYAGALANPPLLVTCDMRILNIRTNFNNRPMNTSAVNLERLDNPNEFDKLRRLFFDPNSFKPKETTEEITQRVAGDLAELSAKMRKRGMDGLQVARFLDRCVFCFFAEDVGLIPEKKLTKILEDNRYNPERCSKLIASLFATMATGGDFGDIEIRHFNGNLFSESIALDLSQTDVDALRNAALKDWANVNPSIMGTLFERALDETKRSQLGAHYTGQEDILTLVEPVVMQPLRQKWHDLSSEWLLQIETAPQEARVAVETFLDELGKVRVLDPACGSGNFLYVTLQQMLNLEADVHAWMAINGVLASNENIELRVRPEQFAGLELNPYALDLAQTSLWVGYLQWRVRRGFPWPPEPILRTTANFQNMDSVLDLTDPNKPQESEWPAVDFIIGNPPFLGGSKLWEELGRDYQKKLWKVYKDRVPGGADLCCYWFEKARQHIADNKAQRAGLIATQSIRGGANREVLKRVKESGDIFFAVADQNWVLDGAAVHISIVGFDDGTQKSRVLDEETVATIHADLSSAADVTQAKILATSKGISFMGPSPKAPFDIPEKLALSMLSQPNPTGQANSDVIRPVASAIDIVGKNRDFWTLDFGLLPMDDAVGFEQPFEYVRKIVYPIRAGNIKQNNTSWWQYERPRIEMRKAINGLVRFLVTPGVAKHRIFVWRNAEFLCNQGTLVFARDDDYFFGILHSRLHEVWSLKQGTQLESRPRYTPTTSFETFPFPEPNEEQKEAIGAAAKHLDFLRNNWLNPPEWTKKEILEFSGSNSGPWARYVHDADSHGIGTVRYPRRVPKDPILAMNLVKRTLTNLYNERPAWLANAHRKLDEAVFAAYGWPVDLTDDEILAKLLELNLARAVGNSSGTTLTTTPVI